MLNNCLAFQEITPHTPFVLPSVDKHGRVVAEPKWGGRRRVDRILYNPKHIFGAPNAFYFSTALASLTDHIPVIMQLKLNENVSDKIDINGLN